MNTLVVKVKNEENLEFLKELLLQFDFVVKLEYGSSADIYINEEKLSVAGKLAEYSSLDKLSLEKDAWTNAVKDKYDNP